MTKIATLDTPSGAFDRIARFNADLRFEDIPEDVRHMAALYMLDLIGVAAAGGQLDAGRIARDHAVKHWAPGPGAPSARLLFDGRSASLPGFGFAMATQIDNLDAHDGWQPSKGHAGAALFPALAAFAQGAEAVSGREALTAFVAGYEIAYRAGVALHATVEDYHTSGAWNALGCAAIGARLRGSSEDTLRHALGIAEYHGPRSQMMREIANPTMLHDGSGFGAPIGILAVLLAEDGFTGAPAATVEFDDAVFAWDTLGAEWLTTQQYIKPYPICRWAHASIDAALTLRAQHSIAPEAIERVDIATFGYSADLNCDVPTTTSNAQYSLAWPVACALTRGRVGVDEVMEPSFSDPALVALTRRISAHVDPQIDATFPEERLASVVVSLKDGSVLNSGITRASGGPDPQPGEAEIVDKFHTFAAPVIGKARSETIARSVLSLGDEASSLRALLDDLTDKV